MARIWATKRIQKKNDGKGYKTTRFASLKVNGQISENLDKFWILEQAD